MGDSTVEPLRLVILGKTGVGKSLVGNVILGTKEFPSKASANSVTQECKKAEVTEGGRRIEVTDTPGIMDTRRSADVVAKEILRCIKVSSPGPHAFLLVLQVTRFTKEEQNAVRALQVIFGKRVADYMIVVFNRADELEDQTIEDYVKDGTPELLNVIRECGGRYVPFYKDLNNREQVDDLVRKVEALKGVNGGEHFSNEVYLDSVKNPESFEDTWWNKMKQWVKDMFGRLKRSF